MKWVFGFLVISILANALLIKLFLDEKQKKADPTLAKREQYPFLARRIFFEEPNDVIINFSTLRQDLRGYIQKDKKPIAVYFQYLPTGSSIGVNDTVPFVAASLLKTPTAMYVYKLIERGEVSKNDEITLTEELIDNRYGTLWEKGPGTKLTIKELLEQSLLNSDNTAHNVLFHSVVKGSPDDVYDNLDIPRQVVNGSPAITVKNYSSILRSLFFSSYLSFESSNEILSMLTKISEGSNLRSNVPTGIPIAQKIGVFEMGGSENHYIYSDCGIFYVPNRPYILCIMSQEDEETASKYAQHISEMVYSYVSSFRQYE
jgi:beta-lactamase class A